MQSRPPSLGALLRAADWEASIEADEEDVFRMRSSVGALEKALADGRLVYGMNRGYGALVEFSASESVDEQGRGLIAHLGTAQGQPLPADVSRLAVWIRLNSMRSGYSSVSPELWGGLADLWNRGFTPVIPRDGTVSASGDLQPLSSAASAFAGEGECWHREDDGTLVPRPAAEVLAELGADPVRWPAREALAFVNGTSVGLARTVHNHREVLSLLRVGALLTGRMATLLGADPVAYHPDLSMVRGQVGQSTVAGWIRSYMPESAVRAPSRPLQEPYSLRCAPQVLGAVLDQLDAMEPILLREAVGVTDNPVLVDGEVLHGGNFHAMPVALSSDQLGLCLQQVAFLAERPPADAHPPARRRKRSGRSADQHDLLRQPHPPARHPGLAHGAPVQQRQPGPRPDGPQRGQRRLRGRGARVERPGVPGRGSGPVRGPDRVGSGGRRPVAGPGPDLPAVGGGPAPGRRGRRRQDTGPGMGP
ncbi:aromatic amino acid lyase family protein [Nocardiopsis alba ATCC BAA-2165]|uniref:Aromatic amino acid lyase family protein n=1 Tax=Nocardiopsis alba (strain ATCC BAA-2165 / BE74) TaxID=1205910 RepID=J7L6M0_NOCAA|nr:aromatic amino acid lyase family protein [Nocardiopsis alba ATCC BAA-2165]